MTARSTGGSSGIAAIAAEIPGEKIGAGRVAPQEPEPDGDDDETACHDQQDADEAVELSLQGGAAALGLGEAARDPAQLGPSAGRDDDPFAPSTDDRRAGEEDRSAVRDDGADFVRFDRGELGHGLPGQDAPVDEECIRAADPEISRHDIARPEQHDIAGDDVRGEDVVRTPRATH